MELPAVRARGCGKVETVAHAVAELAFGDAQDGRAVRTRAEFEQSLALGAGALVALGLRAA